MGTLCCGLDSGAPEANGGAADKESNSVSNLSAVVGQSEARDGHCGDAVRFCGILGENLELASKNRNGRSILS